MMKLDFDPSKIILKGLAVKLLTSLKKVLNHHRLLNLNLDTVIFCIADESNYIRMMLITISRFHRVYTIN